MVHNQNFSIGPKFELITRSGAVQIRPELVFVLVLRTLVVLVPVSDPVLVFGFVAGSLLS